MTVECVYFTYYYTLYVGLYEFTIAMKYYDCKYYCHAQLCV